MQIILQGRVRTKTVKKASRQIIEKYYNRLTLDFHTNKRVAEEVAVIQSKRLRNKIAGFTTVSCCPSLIVQHRMIFTFAEDYSHLPVAPRMSIDMHFQLGKSDSTCLGVPTCKRIQEDSDNEGFQLTCPNDAAPDEEN